MYKFEKLEVYKIALDYVDLVYALAGKLPRIEEYNLKPQGGSGKAITKAASDAKGARTVRQLTTGN